MKKVLIIITLFFSFYSYSQHNVIIKFKDGREVSDKVILTNKKLISLQNSQQYKFTEISEIVLNKDNSIYNFYLIEAKLYLNSKESQLGLATKFYDSKTIELYRISFGLNLDNLLKPNKNTNPNLEVFIKRKKENYAYSIGFVDGEGWRKIKKRLKDFFNDCQELITQINKNCISEKDIYKIVRYYNKSCGD
jgi:hypothetical protein